MKILLIRARYKPGTYTARILGKPGFQASCTAGDDQAAKAVVRKFYGEDAAEGVRPMQRPDRPAILNRLLQRKPRPEDEPATRNWLRELDALQAGEVTHIAEVPR